MWFFGLLLGCLFGWPLSIFLAIYVAGEKNRSLFEGLLLALLFGPFGILIVALLPTKPKANPRQPWDDDRIRELNERPLVWNENRIDEGEVDRILSGD